MGIHHVTTMSPRCHIYDIGVTLVGDMGDIGDTGCETLLTPDYRPIWPIRAISCCFGGINGPIQPEVIRGDIRISRCHNMGHGDVMMWVILHHE